MDLLGTLGVLGVVISLVVLFVLGVLLPISAYSAQKWAHACFLELRKLNAAMERDSAHSQPLPETVGSTSPFADLHSPNPEVRQRCANRFGERGAAAIDALPELELLATSDPDRGVRNRAQWAVEEIRRKSRRSK